MSNSSSSEQSPGRLAIVAMEQHNEVIFKTPLPVKKKRIKQKILDEDTYVERMGKIIERDFFPDLEKLRAQHDYLEAVEKNDVIKIRELNLKYNKPANSERIPSPATFETPANIHNTQGSEDNIPETITVPSSEEKQKGMSLDTYLATHTSEDNQSFEEIMEETERKHRLKYAYLYNEESQSAEQQRAMLALPGIEQQALPPVKPLNIDTWGYKNRNYIMYVPDGVDEPKERQQEVVHNNTRLANNPFNDSQSKEAINELAKKQAKILDGKIGVDGKELIATTPKIMGFSLVRTPSPSRIAQSPLMTWGEVEGTPFRLEGGDTPLLRSFKMNEPPKREQLALQLAEKHRDRKKSQSTSNSMQRLLATPKIDRLSSMSPAAQRLATARLKLATSPMIIASSPRNATTSSSRTTTPHTPSTPKLNLGIRKVGDLNLTDDLLNINLPKRQKAADFF